MAEFFIWIPLVTKWFDNLVFKTRTMSSTSRMTRSAVSYGLRMFSSSPLSEVGLFQNVNKMKINIFRRGNGRHNVLCLPGALGSWRTDFAAQLFGPNALDENEFTVIGWDPPGYGSSRPPDRDFSRGFFGRDAKLAHNLMFNMNLIPYSILGWSDGGITAMIMAYLQRNTNMIKKLVLWGANAYVSDKDIKIYEQIRDVSKWSEKMRSPMIELYGEEYFRKSWEQWCDALIGIYKEEDGNLCRNMLGEILNETMIIHGDKDAVVEKEHPNYLKENLRFSRPVVWLSEGKHNLHLRYADWFKEQVERFLKEPTYRPRL